MIYNSKNKYKFIKLFVTNQCNLDCPYCCFGNQIGRCTEKFPPEYRQHHFKKFLSYLDSTFDYKFVIRLLGGEPLLYPLLGDLIDFIMQMRHLAYIELYSNLTAPIPEQLKGTNSVVISSIHNYEDVNDRLVHEILKNAEASGLHTQFNMLVYNSKDIDRVRKLVPKIREIGASAFPQLIQGRASEKYTKAQRSCMPEMLDATYAKESYYCKYLHDNFGLKYLDFFNQYNEWYDNATYLNVVQSSYTLESDLRLHMSNGGWHSQFIDNSEHLHAEFPLRIINTKDIFINELLFSNAFWARTQE